MTRHRTARTLAALALALAATAGARAEAGPGKGETLRIQDFPGGGNTLMRVAIAEHFCEKYGIKCEVRQLANGPMGVQAFMAGELEVAYSGPEVVLPAIARGADVKVVSGNYAPQPFFLAVRKGMALPDAAKGYPAVMRDFKGLKIGVPARGSHAETLFTEMLAEAGLAPTDVTFVAVGGPATAVPPLVNKLIDAAMMFSPVDGLCEVRKVCDVVVDLRRGEGPKPARESYGSGAPMWMKAEYIQQHPDAVKALRLAVADAAAFVRNPANFDAVMKITDGYFKIPGADGEQVVRATMKNSIAGFDAAIHPKALQAVIDYMVENKQLPKKLNAESLIAP